MLSAPPGITQMPGFRHAPSLAHRHLPSAMPSLSNASGGRAGLPLCQKPEYDPHLTGILIMGAVSESSMQGSHEPVLKRPLRFPPRSTAWLACLSTCTWGPYLVDRFPWR